MQHAAAYILDQFRRAHHAEGIPIGYGPVQGPGVWIQPSPRVAIFGQEGLIRKDEVVEGEWDGRRVPFLFGAPPAGEWWTREGDALVLHVDVVANAFYFLSGWQEHVDPTRDDKGRYPHAASLQAQLQCQELPVVDVYLDILRAAAEAWAGRAVPQRNWSGGRFAFFGSHDIDTCESAWKQGGKHALKRGHLHTFVGLLVRKALGRDAWFNFEEIMALEKAHGACSTFFFIARDNVVNGFPNADYDIRTPKMRQVLAQVAAAGSEVGLHGSLGSHLDLHLILEDLVRLGGSVEGNRFHYLGYDPSLSPLVLEKAGLSYDSSLGFAEHVGFRHGTCRPYFLWDHMRGQATTVLELPLCAMDATFQFAHYMGLGPEAAMAKLDGLMAEVGRWGGVLSVLWHNTHFSAYKYPGWREVYVHALAGARGRGGVFLTGGGVRERWLGTAQED